MNVRMKRNLLLLAAIFVFTTLAAQTKKPLSIEDLTRWNRITERAISDDGSRIAFVTEPWDGDPVVKLYDSEAKEKASFQCAAGVIFTSDSRFLIFTIKPPVDRIRELKLRKTKKEEMPLNMLGIYDINKGITDTIKRLKSYKVPSKWSGWIAYQCEPIIKKDTAGKPKSESEENGYHLVIRNLYERTTDTISFVTEYLLAEKNPVIICSTTGDDKSAEPGVIVLNPGKNLRSTILNERGKYKQLSLSKDGERAAFIVSTDKKDKAGNTYSLFWWNGSGNALLAANRGTPGIPEGWIINENARLIFGEKSNRLFFGTSPEYQQKDTTILDEDRPDVDVWHYKEGTLHTVQIVNKADDIKKSYTAVFHCNSKKVVQLATPERPDVQLIDKGDANELLAVSDIPYELEYMWEGDPGRYDVWLVDILTGSAKKLKENLRAGVRISPAGKYLYWYHAPDSSWYTYNITSGKDNRLTSPETLPCHDELNDIPNFADSYPAAGWLKEDKTFLISDRYDIWSLDPEGKNRPVNVTSNGRKNGITYRLMDLDYENDFIDPSVNQYLKSFSEATKESGFYSLSLTGKNAPELLIGGVYELGTPVKAREESIIIYTKETFGMFPDYLISDLTFKNNKRLTDANPQQKDFIWGSAELIKWVSLDGQEIEGLLYKPEGFDPSKKYPMIVNFYERSSSGLYSHRIPEAHRSTIDYHYYTSNGYIIFNPDVHYKTGFPGQSAYNCVMPGIMSLIQTRFC